MNDQLSLHAILTTKINFVCVQNLKHTVYYIMVVIFIPFYRFILYPLVHKHVPNILKISHCIFDDLTVTGTLPIPLYWVLIIDFANGVGVVLVMCSLFEMVIAQTPNRMRGIMMGVVIVMLGFGTLCITLRHFSSSRQPVPAVCSTTTWYYHYSCC